MTYWWFWELRPGNLNRIVNFRNDLQKKTIVLNFHMSERILMNTFFSERCANMITISDGDNINDILMVDLI